MTLHDVYERLCAPFPIDSIEVRPGSVNRDKTRALAMPYADIRVYQQALDDCVGPDHWQVNYRPWNTGAVICQITLLGVSREDVGELGEDGDNQFTSAVAKAFKRTCSAFGLGRYMYGLPKIWGDYDSDRRGFKDPKGIVEQIYHQAGIKIKSTSAAPATPALQPRSR